MQSGVQKAKRGLGARDLVTMGVCIALYFVFMMVGSMLFAPNPVLTFLMPAGAALLTGPVYLLLVARVPKHGALIILGIVEAVVMFVTGMYWLWSAFLVVLGIVGDLMRALEALEASRSTSRASSSSRSTPWAPTGRASTGGGRGSAASRARPRCRERPWHRYHRCGLRWDAGPRRGGRGGRRRPRGHAARGLAYRPQGGPAHAQPRCHGPVRRVNRTRVGPGVRPHEALPGGRARRGAVPAAESPASPPTHACRRAPPGQGDRPSRGLLRAGGEVQPCACTEADEGLVDRRGLKVAQARSVPARTGLSIPGSKMIRLGDHAAGKPPRVSVPRTPP